MKKNSGHLLYAGIMGVSVLGLIFSAQLLYYHEQLLGYQNMKNYNIARTMRNLALANGISNNEVMYFNRGSVTKKENKFFVKINNRQMVELQTLVKYDSKEVLEKDQDLK